MHYSTTHHSSMTTHPSCQGCTIASTPKRKKFNITERGAEELAPLLGSGPLSRWARGPLSVPCRPDTSTYCAIPHPASLPRWALGLPHVQWLRTPSPYQGGLWCRACVPWLRTLLPIRDGSGDTACPMAPYTASLPGGLRRYNASCNSLWAVGLKHKRT
jgi:hypothetical protein